MNEYFKTYRQKQKDRAQAGKSTCECGNPSIGFKHGGAVCARCDEIENRRAYHYGKNRCGIATSQASTDWYQIGRVSA
jgi:hypothetical protein